jgi:predicted MFS family arabinose efflux permease
MGFVVSALLVMSAALPYRKSTAKRVEGVWRKTTRGMRVYLKTPRLVGLLAVTLAAAAGSAMVIVNTVVIVKNMGGTEGDVALALAAYGAGSMLAALALPRILARINDRTIMIAGGGLLLVTLATIGLVFGQVETQTFWPVLLVGWLTMGIGYSLCVTPNGRLLKRSSADARTFRGNARSFAQGHRTRRRTPAAGDVRNRSRGHRRAA